MSNRVTKLASAAILLSASSSIAQVTLRTGDVIDAPIVSVNESGVQFGGGAPRTVSWDRVRLVEGDFESSAAPFEQMSLDLWRARTRLDRGDLRLAQPIFDRYFARFEQSDGETAAVVALGALRCALANADHEGAVRAWIASVRLIDAGYGRLALDSMNSRDLLIDPETLLCPDLHPAVLRHLSDDERRGLDALTGLQSTGPTSAQRIVRAFLDVGTSDPDDQPPAPSLLAEEVLDRVRALQSGSRVQPDPGRPAWLQAWDALSAVQSVPPNAERDRLVRALFTGLEGIFLVGEARPVLASRIADEVALKVGASLGFTAESAIQQERVDLASRIANRTGLEGWLAEAQEQRSAHPKPQPTDTQEPDASIEEDGDPQ